MFNKKTSGQNNTGDKPEDAPQAYMPRTTTPRPAEDLLARKPQNDIPRARIPSVPNDTRGPSKRDDDSKLLVGDGITLKGEVTNCAELIIEGHVDARVEAQRFEVSRSGVYAGDCHVEEADIAGQFDGVLNCRGKLIVRSTGRLKGTLRYGDVEIEAGGRIAGEIQVYGEDDAAVEPAPALKAAAD